MASGAQLEALRTRPHVTYVARSSMGAALYVGCTHDLRQRMRGHRGNHSPWLAEMHHMETTEHTNWWAARLDEEAKIRELAPTHNQVRMVTDKDRAAWQWMAEQFDPATGKVPLPLRDPDEAAAHPLMTVTSVAALIGKSTRTVLRLVKAGTLSHTYYAEGLGGVYIFSQADIDAYLAEAEPVQS